jgi:hypothetical protein
MTQIGFNSLPFGVPAGDDHSADVRGPGAGYSVPLMMRRKFIGDSTTKVVCLSNIYRLPQERDLSTENVDSPNWVEGNPSECKVLEFVFRAAGTAPD